MIKHKKKQTRAQNSQAEKERNKSKKWSRTKINKQKDKMFKQKYPKIQTNDVNTKIHPNNNQQWYIRMYTYTPPSPSI